MLSSKSTRHSLVIVIVFVFILITSLSMSSDGYHAITSETVNHLMSCIRNFIARSPSAA
jgi:hypothetical protein